MSFYRFNKKSFSVIATGLFMVVGTYNAVVINSESSIISGQMKFVKRLDEVYGVTQSARGAASTNWQKISTDIKKIPSVSHQISNYSKPSVDSSPSPEKLDVLAPAAAVQAELNLTLTEVVNTKKWEKGLANTEYSGSLNTNGGVIESLSVTLPNGEGVSVSFSEMAGNVFEYDIGGELYSGMMYQVDQTSYMVTLTNGPLEGTRLRFTGEASLEQQEEALTAQIDAEQNVDMNAYSNNGQDTAQAAPEVGFVPTEVAIDQDQAFQQQALQNTELQFQAQEAAPVEAEQAMQNPEEQNIQAQG